MNLQQIEEELKTGQVNPQRLAEMRDWLAVESSSKMDRQDELVETFKFFVFIVFHIVFYDVGHTFRNT